MRRFSQVLNFCMFGWKTTPMSAGYSSTPLVKKLGIKPGFKVLTSNAPEHYGNLLGPLPEGAEYVDEGENLDFIHLFALEKQELEINFHHLMKKLAKNGSLWVSWPKKASKVKTELSDAIVRETGLKAGLVDVKVCAVDQVWSGLKFMYRVKDR